ncbi:MAG: hypothetical protein HOG08_00215, partial [Candidatus Magasanikbacteria bacterium]|nr:hypothetical protein [Candidatus Magasanikbacteria bacterium]
VSGKYAYIVDDAEINIVDIADPTNPNIISTITITSAAADVYVRGKYMYVANNAGGLLVYDVSDPENSTSAGSYAVKTVYSVYADDDYVFAGNSDGTIDILDVDDMSSIRQVAQIGVGIVGLSPIEIIRAGDYLYVADLLDGLRIIDISDPTSATLVSSDDQGGSFYGLSVIGSYVYLANAQSGLRIYDIGSTEIANASIGTLDLSYLEVDHFAQFRDGVHVQNGMHIGNDGLLVGGDIGIYANTTSTSATNTLDFSHTALFSTNVTTTDGNAFIFDTENTLSSGDLLSVRNNGTIRFVVDESGNVGINTSTPGYALTVAGTTYVSGSATLASTLGVTGTSTFSNNVYVGASAESITTSTFVLDGDDMYVHDLLGVGDSLFVENAVHIGTSSLHLSGDVSGGLISMTGGALTIDSASTLNLNTTNNQNVIFGSGNVGINTSTPNYNLVVNGTSYYTGTSTYDGLVDIRGGVVNPKHKGNLLSSGNYDNIFGLSVAGDYAYMLTESDAGVTYFSVIDIKDKAAPWSIATLTETVESDLNDPSELYVSGDYAYVAANNVGGSKFMIIDISDPHNPALISTLTDDGSMTLDSISDIFVLGNYAYVTAFSDDALNIIDISDPKDPRVAGNITASDNTALDGVMALYVSGGFAYLISDDPGGEDALVVVDISNPEDPSYEGTVNSSVIANLVTPHDIFIQGNYAYITTNVSDALEIIDISDPSNPSHIASSTDSGGSAPYLNGASGLFVSGDYAYVASNNSDALEIIDISDPSNPSHMGSILDGEGSAPYLNGAQDIFVQGNYAYMTARTSDALEIIDISGAKISNTQIGTADISNLQVRSYARFENGLNVRNGLHVSNNGLMLGGDFGMYVNTTSTTAINTLHFSHATLFKTAAINTVSSSGFIFDSTVLRNNSDYLFSVRNNGTSKFSISGNGDVNTAGNLYAASVDVGTPGTPGDLAERVDVNPEDNPEPGDVMTIDMENIDRYKKSTDAYSQSVAGVVSTRPTIIVGNGKTEFTVDMAMIGRVPVKVSNENGAIEHGDLLVTASVSGHAMKYDALKDDGTNLVGIIGMALESFEGSGVSTTGKIMTLIKSGWVNNRNQTIAELEQDVLSIAEQEGIPVDVDPQVVQVEEDSSGNLVAINQNLNMNGFGIVNVSHIAGKNNTWSIDVRGRFITTVETSNGDKELYALQSAQTEYVFSGSGELTEGESRISFDDITQDIIDPNKTIKVTVTLTAEANGVYVTDKDETGFTVKELLSGTSSSTFDWVVIAERKGETVIVEEPIVEEPAVEDPPEEAEAPPAEEPVVAEVDPVVEDPEPEVVPDSVVEEPAPEEEPIVEEPVVEDSPQEPEAPPV